jgi:hypothetical protein
MEGTPMKISEAARKAAADEMGQGHYPVNPGLYVQCAINEACKPLVEALVSIEEYWNDERASAVDAAEEMRDRANKALTTHRLAHGQEGET